MTQTDYIYNALYRAQIHSEKAANAELNCVFTLTIATMALLNQVLNKIFGPKSKFNQGDCVQTCDDGPLMIVQWIETNHKII